MQKYIILALFLFLFLASCQENFDKRLQREAQEITRTKCPQEPSPGERLDSIVYAPASRVLSFYYTESPTNEAILLGRTTLLRANLVAQLIADVNYKEVKDKGITFRYVYMSEHSERPLFETKITAAEYKK